MPMISDNLKQLEDNLWRSADTLRANSGLKASEYSTPILGLIFLKFADNKYWRYEKEILAEYGLQNLAISQKISSIQKKN